MSDRPQDRDTAAKDRDVELVRRAIDKLSGLDTYQLAKGDGLMALDALDRINQRLEVGTSLAAIVDECVKAGHISAVKP